MTAINWLALALLAIVTYLAAIHLALLGFSRSALQRRLEERDPADGPERGKRLLERLPAATLTVTLLRSVSSVSYFAAVLVSVVGFGENLTVTWPTLLTVAGLTVLPLWLLNSVLASAIARHAGTGVLVRSIAVLHVAAFVGRPLSLLLATATTSRRSCCRGWRTPSSAAVSTRSRRSCSRTSSSSARPTWARS
jgi:hypothetical protein